MLSCIFIVSVLITADCHYMAKDGVNLSKTDLGIIRNMYPEKGFNSFYLLVCLFFIFPAIKPTHF